MIPKTGEDYECQTIGCLDDGYILLDGRDEHNLHPVKKCEYCHNNNKSRFALHQVVLRLQGAKYNERYFKYE